MYTIYPEVELATTGIFIDIKSPWFVEKVADLRKDFYESRIFEYPIFSYTPRKNFANAIASFIGPKTTISCAGLYNHANIKNASYCPNKKAFDPISVYTAIQHERLLYNNQKDRNGSFIIKLLSLRETNEPKLFALIKKLLLQSYAVTYHCNDSLLPASNGTDAISQFMCQYIREEHGHHNLIELSLKELDQNINLDQKSFSEQVRETMDTLKKTANYSTIALACALGFFEAASFQPSDPIADILEASSKPKAAKGIKTHFDINKRGNHGLIGYKLSSLINSYITEHELDFTISQMEKIEELSSTLIEDIFYD